MENDKLTLTFLLCVITLVYGDAGIPVYRYETRDIFKNPDYTSVTNCGINTCKNYKAKCVEEDNCCLCRCNGKFSTYNQTEGRCTADKTLLSDSLFRFVKNGKIQSKIILLRLIKSKDLGQIRAVGDTKPLRRCKVARDGSQYWSETEQGGWKSLKNLTEKRVFVLSQKKDSLTLKSTGSRALLAKLQGFVIRVAVQCVGINSTIIFKTRKNYNDKNFIGCLTPKMKTQMNVSHNCSTITPRLCTDFCRALGRSLAALTNGKQCVCGEMSEANSWLRTRSSCVIPCLGDPSKFCGGKQAYSLYASMPEWPNDFKFSSNGSLDRAKYRCAAITEPEHSSYWTNSTLCSKKIGTPIKITWLFRERKRVMNKLRCTKIVEPEEPSSSSWENNFLCVPPETPLTFRWSHSGPISGKECIKWSTDDPHGWNNNYLCADRPKESEVDVTSFCPRQPSGHSSTVLLPSKNISPSAAYRPASVLHSESHYNSNLLPLKPHPSPSLSTLSQTIPTLSRSSFSQSSVSVNDVLRRNQSGSDKSMVAFYVAIPLACIFTGFFVGVLFILHFKKRKALHVSTDPKLKTSDFTNPTCSDDEETEVSIVENYPRRKSKTDRLPSLPIQTKSAEDAGHYELEKRRKSKTDRLPSLPIQTKSAEDTGHYELEKRRKSKTDRLPSLPIQTKSAGDTENHDPKKKRKSRTDRLPSLPFPIEPGQPDLITSHLGKHPADASFTSHEKPPQGDDKHLLVENNVDGFYETPAHDNMSEVEAKDDLSNFQSSKSSLKNETDSDKPSVDVGFLHYSPSYENIDSYFDPESVYLEVLP